MSGLEPLLVVGLGLVGLLAGAVDSVAGGGGLLTVPALLAAGLPPTSALGTNKAQAVVGSSTAAARYVAAGASDLRSLLPAVATTFLGAVLGVLLLRRIDPGVLTDALPWVLLALAVYVAVSPRLGEVERVPRISARAFALSAAPGIGAYDGLLGPGTGSFFALAFVGLRGRDLVGATAATKVLNATSNAAALLVFAVVGDPVWVVAAVMAVGQAVGARLGAGAVLTRGTGLVRPALAIVSAAISLRLLLG